MQVVAQIQYTRCGQIGIGQGMNSTVFLAHDPQLCGYFAVKEIEKSRLGNDVTLYFAEAQAMFATSHPNIVPIQYACETVTHIVLAMPHFASGSLATRISSNYHYNRVHSDCSRGSEWRRQDSQRQPYSLRSQAVER
jgi:eukaryotic-like serine/threonine-protein kinase